MIWSSVESANAWGWRNPAPRVGNFALLGVTKMKSKIGPKHYDETKVFMDEIYPLLSKAHALCDKYELPMVTYCQYGQEDDADDDSKTRASISQMVCVPGDRAMPLFHALAAAADKPHEAALLMMGTALVHRGSIKEEDEKALRSKAKDSTAELLAQFTKPGHA